MDTGSAAKQSQPIPPSMFQSPDELCPTITRTGLAQVTTAPLNSHFSC